MYEWLVGEGTIAPTTSSMSKHIWRLNGKLFGIPSQNSFLLFVLWVLLLFLWCNLLLYVHCRLVFFYLLQHPPKVWLALNFGVFLGLFNVVENIRAHFMSVLAVLWSLWHVGLPIIFWHVWMPYNECKNFLMVLKVSPCVYKLSKPCKVMSHPYTKSWALSHKCRHSHLKAYLKCRTCCILSWGSHTEENCFFMCSNDLCCHVIKVC